VTPSVAAPGVTHPSEATALADAWFGVMQSVSCCSETEELRLCINELNCSRYDVWYRIHQRVIGISIGDQYLCSDTARPGNTRTQRFT